MPNTKNHFDHLYYIHGYQSSPESQKGIIFKEKLGATAIPYRDCLPEDLVIADCLNRISTLIPSDKNIVLIGSSLGGFLAAVTALDHPNVQKLVLLNPAIIPPSTDLDTVQGMPRRILKDMIDKRLFENRLTADVVIFRGTNDDIVPDNWFLPFAKAQEATVIFLADDHRFSSSSTRIPDILLQKKWL